MTSTTAPSPVRSPRPVQPGRRTGRRPRRTPAADAGVPAAVPRHVPVFVDQRDHRDACGRSDQPYGSGCLCEPPHRRRAVGHSCSDRRSRARDDRQARGAEPTPGRPHSPTARRCAVPSPSATAYGSPALPRSSASSPAAGVGLVDLVVAGDAMVKKGLATLESLTRSVDGMSGAGVRVARRAVAYVRVGVDSAMESRLRMLLVLAGFPEPEVNVILRNLSGDWSRRFDMCYLALKLIIEYDGEQHGDLDHRDSDIHRREELERLGYTLVQVTSLGHLQRSRENPPEGGRCPARGRRARARPLAPRVAAALSRASVGEGGIRLNASDLGVKGSASAARSSDRNPPPSQQRRDTRRPRPPEPTAESTTADTRRTRPPEPTPESTTAHPEPRRTPNRGAPERSPHPTRIPTGRAAPTLDAKQPPGAEAQPTAGGGAGLESQKPDSSRRRRQRSSILSMKVPSEEVP